MGRGYHTACTHCSSSDAMYVYPDNSTFCFSCRFSNKSSKYTPNVVRETEDEKLELPTGCTQDYDERAVWWFVKYGLDVEDMIKHGLLWYDIREQLIFPFYDGSGTLVAWQARNFNPRSKAKAFTKGNIKEIFPIYKGNDKLVLVEDCVSAIKVNKYAGLSTMPLLGSGLSKNKLPTLINNYKHIYVWLDSNMLHNAKQIANQVSIIGGSSSVIFTERDPKECDITDVLKVQ